MVCVAVVPASGYGERYSLGDGCNVHANAFTYCFVISIYKGFLFVWFGILVVIRLCPRPRFCLARINRSIRA